MIWLQGPVLSDDTCCFCCSGRCLCSCLSVWNRCYAIPPSWVPCPLSFSMKPKCHVLFEWVQWLWSRNISKFLLLRYHRAASGHWLGARWKCRIWDPTPNLFSQKLHFPEISWWFMCKLSDLQYGPFFSFALYLLSVYLFYVLYWTVSFLRAEGYYVLFCIHSIEKST